MTNIVTFTLSTALEVAILFAHVTGRILVLPPNAVLYLLIMNKAWGNNKSSVEDFIDFDRMRAGFGLETITMKEFLSDVAAPGFLYVPLPDNKTDLIKNPLWAYMEAACYTRQWATGKTFIGFNLSTTQNTINFSEGEGEEVSQSVLFGSFKEVEQKRMNHVTLNLKRKLIPYDEEFHSQRAIFFSGSQSNRLLTHWYAYFFFAEPKIERSAKRFMRDRVRYHDGIYCAAGRVIDLILSEVTILRNIPHPDNEKNVLTMDEIEVNIGSVEKMPLVSYAPHGSHHSVDGDADSDGDGGADDDIDSRRVYRLLSLNNSYIAYHIRRGDFQQKHTRLEAADILNSTLHLLPNNPQDWLVYIATDERNRTFFDDFHRTFRSVRFLHDYEKYANLSDMNQNHLGMLEQVVCANAHTFIGTPLSTFTSYITRMRGYMGKTTLVEVNPALPSALLSDIYQYNERINERTLSSSNNPTFITPLLHEQIGLPIELTNEINHKLIGKIFIKNKVKTDKIKNNEKPYTENEEKNFMNDLLLRPRTLYQRSTATIHHSPSKRIPFLTEKYITEMSLKDSETISSASASAPLAVGIYQRTYYFIDRFTYQLQARPNLYLPFWVRDFSDPFMDLEEEVDYETA